MIQFLLHGWYDFVIKTLAALLETDDGCEIRHFGDVDLDYTDFIRKHVTFHYNQKLKKLTKKI